MSPRLTPVVFTLISPPHSSPPHPTVLQRCAAAYATTIVVEKEGSDSGRMLIPVLWRAQAAIPHPTILSIRIFSSARLAPTHHCTDTDAAFWTHPKHPAPPLDRHGRLFGSDMHQVTYSSTDGLALHHTDIQYLRRKRDLDRSGRYSAGSSSSTNLSAKLRCAASDTYTPHPPFLKAPQAHPHRTPTPIHLRLDLRIPTTYPASQIVTYSLVHETTSPAGSDA
ncbi:hypothetical protein C8R45DRAFT_1149728 [Mycena sanguinolenta]|nr:hypothetical protein C8R45DRAFT_1149728 [Mycena sanguinolenta]